MLPEGMAARWQDAARGDAALARMAAQGMPSGGMPSSGMAGFSLAGVAFGAAGFGEGPARFSLEAPEGAWARALAFMPERHHHSLFAMRMRVPGFAIVGDELAFAQHAHMARRVLELGRWVMAGKGGAAPEFLGPALVEPEPAEITGRYVRVGAYQVYVESAGEGPNTLLCLHTAGSDGRQFHRLMADRRLTRDWRLVSFDLPWHGKSPPPSGAAPGTWRLDTERYIEIIMGVVRAAGLGRPAVLGASMSGEICLELALRHPDAFRGIVACEASDNIQGRRVPWADHPQVNQAIFVPEWIYGLMAPGTPAACAGDIWWQYSQGGHATFARDIDFYSGEWDARDRVAGIDTARCPLFMLTGEYDYSCTAEHSEATAAKIAGVRFQRMAGIGHFPFAENPALFAEYLLPCLAQLNQ